MTWLEFKTAVESAGVTDEMEILWVDIPAHLRVGEMQVHVSAANPQAFWAEEG